MPVADTGCGTQKRPEREISVSVPLPEEFCGKMRGLLGQEYESFIESYGKQRRQGLRINPLRLDVAGSISDGKARDDFSRGLWTKIKEQFGLRRIPWAEEGWYYDADTHPGRHPYHEAGLYYIQEPSAMAVAELLDPKPGERILDLCAAPGGKSTQIAGRMKNKGLLVSNEIHPERARVLSRNIERMGIGNAVVTNETPEKLVRYFPEFFDRILVDAPCSGEGMFRKDEAARREWSPENVALCAERQAGILDCAALMLRPGGLLVYSTCTFSPEENEGSVLNFLKRHVDFTVDPVRSRLETIPEKRDVLRYLSAGRPDWAGAGTLTGCGAGTLTGCGAGTLTGCGAGILPGCCAGTSGASSAVTPAKALSIAETFRIWPHRAEGEGHYIALMRKADQSKSCSESQAETRQDANKNAKYRSRSERKKGNQNRDPAEKADRQTQNYWKAFCEDNLLTDFSGEDRELTLFGDQLYLKPGLMVGCRGLKILRPGLHLGTIKKGRFEPSHALALCLSGDQVRSRYSIPAESPKMERYLRGEAIDAGPEAGHLKAGWVLIQADGLSIGWARKVGDTLKNHYPKGLRRK